MSDPSSEAVTTSRDREGAVSAAASRVPVKGTTRVRRWARRLLGAAIGLTLGWYAAGLV